MGVRHKKTRQEKILADLRRKNFVYTLENKNLPSMINLQDNISKTNIADVSSYSYIRHDILKTSLLTASIIGFQIILFIFLKNHIIVLPMVSYWRGVKKLYGINVLCKVQSKKRGSKCSGSYNEEWQAGNERQMPSLRNRNVQDWQGLNQEGISFEG